MAVQEKMAQLEAVKADIKQALIDKGVDMTGVTFTQYGTKITELRGFGEIAEAVSTLVIFPFTNDLDDYSIYGRNVAKSNVTLNDSGATFNGSNSKIEIDNVNLSNYSDFTVEFILSNCIADFGTPFSQKTTANCFAITKDISNRLAVMIKGVAFIVYSNELDFTAEHHFAVVKTGTIYSVYVDGVLHNRVTYTTPIPSINGVKIGDCQNTDFLNGTMGGFKLSGKALSPSEFSLARPFKIQNPNSGQSEKTYLFKDGVLDPSITLPSNLSMMNNIIYTNSAGGTSWTINYPFEQGQTFCIKSTCTADAGSPGNESYISTNVAGKTGVIRFPGEGEQNDILTFGILCNSTATSASLYLYTYGKAMGIVEMWVE
ncbi:LamG-like jellyroll fold domain-containing protein [Holdemania massiliensis]|uniref:LamG-like jellyroll fold domain-containing protein n=1 Tax=Holdemania massiliensis TaxID=1468449 RepID=UPI0035681E9D